jgi:membrane associated rhomboid family serine protease
MLIPYSTDAPIYHYPIATGGFIVACSAASLVLWSAPEQLEPFLLLYGQWNPIQWITSVFLHADIFHLLMNMVFLWIFGLVVEGKVGWLQMIAMFLGIGIAQSGIEQTLMLGAETGGSLGASAAIYGLMAASMVWAPMNEISCIYLLGFRVYQFDVKIWVLACLYLALDFIFAAIGGFTISSEILHLMGAMIGLSVATAMVSRGWVDCENWDVFSLRRGRHRMTREQLREEKFNSAENQQKLQHQRETTLKQIHASIAEGNPGLAYAAHDHSRRMLSDWSLPDQDLLRIIVAFHQKQQWHESIPAMKEYLGRGHPPQEAAVRLRLARVLIDVEQKPSPALRVLAKIAPESLEPAQKKAFEQLRQKATKLREENPYEVVEGDW